MILILTQCFPPRLGGVESLMGGLAEAAAASGQVVAVLADGPRDPADGGKSYRLRRFAGLKPLRRWRKGRAAARAARGVELVIADSWKSLEWVGALPVATRVHCLAHGMEFPLAPSPRKAARIARALAKADRVLANSRHTAEQVRPYLGAAARLSVATPPIPPQPEAGARAAAALEPLLTLGDGTTAGGAPPSPLVVTLCRLEPRKGVDRLIAAVADLRGAYPGLGLAVAGDGPDRARLTALAAALGVLDRVRFLGRVDEPRKAALLARADLFAMPARREGDSVEGFGIVYLEAGWHGAPSLAGREGGAADAVRDGETGLLCDGADPGSVTSALDGLLGDPGRLAAMGAAAVEHARAQVWSARLDDFLAPMAR